MEDNIQEILEQYRTKVLMVAIHLVLLFLFGGAMVVIPTLIYDYLIFEIDKIYITILIITIEILLVYLIVNSIRKAWKYLTI